jgi:hypothetical protein
VGLVRDGHPDALAGSGAEVVGALTQLADNVVKVAALGISHPVPVVAPPHNCARSAYPFEKSMSPVGAAGSARLATHRTL